MAEEDPASRVADSFRSRELRSNGPPSTRIPAGVSGEKSFNTLSRTPGIRFRNPSRIRVRELKMFRTAFNVSSLLNEHKSATSSPHPTDSITPMNLRL